MIAPGSMLTATLGARVAHSLSRRRLSQAFGVFLLLVGSRMLYRALSLTLRCRDVGFFEDHVDRE